jgi:hypothetical protein
LLLSLRSIRHPWNASFLFSFLYLKQSVELLEREISPSQGHYLTQTDIHALSGIRTYDLSVWEDEHFSWLRPRGQYDRLVNSLITNSEAIFCTPLKEINNIPLHKHFAYKSTSTIINLQPRKCTMFLKFPKLSVCVCVTM